MCGNGSVPLSHSGNVVTRIGIHTYTHDGNNNWKVSLKYAETARGVVETRRTVENLPKDHYSGKNQSRMTSVKYDHLHVMETITGKFHRNPLRNVGGVAETRTSVDKMAKTV